MDESEQNVFCADVIMVEQACLFLSQNYDSAGSICKALKHLRAPSALPKMEWPNVMTMWDS
jgi:hypothetical protein